MVEPLGPFCRADMESRIADELARTDISSEIANAINDAIVAYQDETFLFNELIFTWQTNQNIPAGQTYQEFYTVNDVTTTIIGPNLTNAIGLLNKIDYLFLYNDGPTPWVIDPREPEYMEWASQSGTFVGQPYEYSFYAQQIRLFPVPNAVFTMRAGAKIQYQAPTSDTDTTSPWFNVAERLIRNRAKLELAVHVLRDPDMIAIFGGPTFMTEGTVKGTTGEAFKQLKSRSNLLTKMGRGQVRPMHF